MKKIRVRKFVPATGSEVASHLNREVRGLSVRKVLEFRALVREQERKAERLLKAVEAHGQAGFGNTAEHHRLVCDMTEAVGTAIGMSHGLTALLRFAKLAKSRTAFAASLPTAFVGSTIFSRPWKREE